jgi:hypothetical protein
MKNIIASTIIFASAFCVEVVSDFAWANQLMVEAEPATKASTATNDPSISLELAQHIFSTRYIRENLNELRSEQGNWRRTPGFVERFTLLSDCVHGLKQCEQALGYLFNPSHQDLVDLVCIEINASGASENWSVKFAQALTEENYPFPIWAAETCSRETITEQTYKLSVSISDCSGQSCSARTYVKRIREWCGTVWKTTRSVVNVDGFEFAVLDGLEVELLKSEVGDLPGSQ